MFAAVRPGAPFGGAQLLRTLRYDGVRLWLMRQRPQSLDAAVKSLRPLLRAMKPLMEDPTLSPLYREGRELRVSCMNPENPDKKLPRAIAYLERLAVHDAFVSALIDLDTTSQHLALGAMMGDEESGSLDLTSLGESLVALVDGFATVGRAATGVQLFYHLMGTAVTAQRDMSIKPLHADVPLTCGAAGRADPLASYRQDGTHSMRRQKFGRAMRRYEQGNLLEILFREGQPYVNSLLRLARAYLGGGHYSLAKLAVLRAAQMDERDHANTVDLMALIYETEGHDMQAAPLYQRALALDPMHGRHVCNYAYYLLRQGRILLARHFLHRGISLNEAKELYEIEAYFYLADIERALHHFGASERIYLWLLNKLRSEPRMWRPRLSDHELTHLCDRVVRALLELWSVMQRDDCRARLQQALDSESIDWDRIDDLIGPVETGLKNDLAGLFAHEADGASGCDTNVTTDFDTALNWSELAGLGESVRHIPELERLSTEARGAMEAGEYLRASCFLESLFIRQYLARGQADLESHVLLSRAYAQQGFSNVAYRLLVLARERMEEPDLDFFRTLAARALAANQPDAAREAFLHGRDERLFTGDDHALLARIYWKEDNLRAARASLETAIEMNTEQGIYVAEDHLLMYRIYYDCRYAKASRRMLVSWLANASPNDPDYRRVFFVWFHAISSFHAMMEDRGARARKLKAALSEEAGGEVLPVSDLHSFFQDFMRAMRSRRRRKHS
jgi:tetratricopeptide (TPR) repeat protein